MKLNRKGFTLVELMAVIAIIGILSGFAVMAVTGYKERTRKKLYTNYEKQMKDATVNYFTKNIDEIPDVNNSTTINLQKLVDDNYLESFTDPLKESSKCTGKIIVTNKSNIHSGSQNPDNMGQGLDENGNIVAGNISNLDLQYKVCLMCSQYKTSQDCS